MASPAWCGRPRTAGGRCVIPGKDNGLDIEGLAVDGHRLLLDPRGPVLRGWSALLEIAVEARGDHLRLVPHGRQLAGGQP